MFSELFINRIHGAYYSRKEAVLELCSGERGASEFNQAFLSQLDLQIKECSQNEQTLLYYLYGNMPLSDLFNYSFETMLDYAKHGVFLWEKGPFARCVDEEIFCQYVVYHRVNTEDISPCRSYFYGKVCDKGQAEAGGFDSMEQAVLEVNYWCAQEASYRASDDRTASPMTVYKSSCGRCGEESAFVVSVLRSMGIPARQVYAPRWSHCDDNHAWVEVFCKDTWYFIGACEPEEVLNKGWFLHASSRAMLIHSRWYGKLRPEGVKQMVHEQKVHNNLIAGKLISIEGVAAELNETARYANTKAVKIRVQDLEANPICGAKVRIEILNYAEFFPVAVLLTDSEGCAEIDMGMGSCRIRAVKEGEEASRIICVETDSEIQLTLGERAEEVFELFAPKDAPIHTGAVTDEQKQTQKEKLAERTALRLKKTGTGNEAELEQFLAEGNESERQQLLGTLSEKDHLDVRGVVLEAHLKHAKQYKGQFPDELFISCILAPRISAEIITDYRNEIEELLDAEEKIQFKQNPRAIWDYIVREVKQAPEEEYDALLTFPEACLKHKIGSVGSQNVLFVAISRTLGIPARLNPLDQEPEYWDGERFVKAGQCECAPSTKEGAAGSKVVITRGDTVPDTQNGAGVLRVKCRTADSFVYYQNWSVSRLQEDGKKLLDLSGEAMREIQDVQDMEELQEQQSVLEAALPAGRYEVVTANRLPNGNILGRCIVAEVRANQITQLPLILEDAELSQMLESVPVPKMELRNECGIAKETDEILKGANHLVIWMIPGQEPSEHILNELRESAEVFNKSGEKILFIVDGPEALKQKTIMQTMEKLEHVEVFYDYVEERVQVLGRRFYVNPESIPLILVTDKDANSVYAASGYNVGTADMIMKIFSAGVPGRV